ncbi:MAG TPA: 5-oxoprolinase subunit PxpB [Chitinophagales bacterium]|nr:5-oxoprolinase subunit PxpB [Chitinophagales bacterium]
MPPSNHLHPAGDSAITIDFGNIIDEKTNNMVIALFDYLREKKLPGIKDIIPAYSSITIVYDVAITRNQHRVASAFQFIKQYVEDSMQHVDWNKTPSSRQIEIPVCYDPSLAPDLYALASEKKISAEEVVQLHCSKTYRVYMIGFLPGFAYMGKVDERITSPRKTNPDKIVHAGSVGIAGEQTGIYPLDSPGGWNIIGQTPMRMFDAGREEPVLLRAGDEVKFTPITLKEFLKLKL